MHDQDTALIPATRDVALADRFAPKSFTELMSMARIAVESGIIPKNMTESQVVICVQLGSELGIPPMQAIQCIAVINGRPSLFGDIGLALFKARAPYESFEEDAPDVALENQTGRCRIIMKNGDEIIRRFSVQEAQKANLWGKQGPWTNYPGRMLMWRARWWAMRDADPGVFKGISAAEEMQDLEPLITVERPRAIESEAVDSFLKGNDKPKTVSSASKTTQTAQAAGDVSNPYIGTIDKLTTKSGKKGNKPWTLYIIRTIDGPEFTTFDKKVIDNITELGKGNVLVFHWSDGKKPGQMMLEGVDPHIEAAPEPEEKELESAKEIDMFGDA